MSYCHTKECENVFVPDLSLMNDNTCLWAKKPEEKAKNREFKPPWPKSGSVIIQSFHRKYKEITEFSIMTMF